MRYPNLFPKTSLKKAVEFIYEYGRDIDIALYEFYFKRANPSKVINQLMKHVNNDGGFGKGLELDYMYQGSTPLSTTIALNIIRQLHIYSNNHLTFDALDYLSTKKNYAHGWSCITKEVNNYPRAEWWEYKPSMKETYTINPTAEIIGYFYLLGGGVYRNTAHEMLDTCYAHLKNPESCNKMHEIICLMRMCRMLPSSSRNRYIRHLRPRLNDNLCFDTSKYSNYVFTPLSVFESPNDPLYDIFRNQIEDNLDYLIESQKNDGSWAVSWNWNRDEYIFEDQLPLISAHITLENIIRLKSFSRIAL